MAFSDIKDELQNFDWNDLGNVETIGTWPGAVKSLIALVVFSVCVVAGYWFDIKDLQAGLQRIVLEESTLKTEMEQKAFLAANLEEYQAQTDEMNEAFEELLQRLPSQTEVPDLLDDIEETGLGSGLTITSIGMDPEVTLEFYIEQPIVVKVTGNYHDFGTFVSGVASLSRIVTLHDFTITSDQGRTNLEMSITAKTYRYKTDEEQELDSGGANVN